MIAKSLVMWIAQNAEKESGFLSPNPQWNVNAHALLDFIQDVSGEDEATISRWVEEALG